MPITDGRRRSERIDLNFMSPPLKSAEQKVRALAHGAQHIHQQTSCGKTVAESTADNKKPALPPAFVVRYLSLRD
ncbi:MAG: hypothetical protein ACRED3_00570 [Bradyrhizobium sp.]